MSFSKGLPTMILGLLSPICFIPTTALAEDETPAFSSDPALETNSRYGLFNWLDHRSAYSQDFFPQPLLLDDTSLETDGELEFNFLHTQANARRSTVATAEIQKSFGSLTLELGLPYERDSDSGALSRGIGSISFGARYPIYQYVSSNRLLDTTWGIGTELGIPVTSAITSNIELTPKIFNDLKLGNNFSIQSVLGYSMLLGGGENRGLHTFEYGCAFAYAIPQSELPLPGVQRFTPIFELVGETELNKDESGQNSLLGSIGFRADFRPIGDLHPSLGLGYVFPMDSGARMEAHRGIAVSLIFGF